MRIPFSAMLIAGLVLFGGGCGSEGSYRLHLIFADDAPRASVNQVELFAIEQGKNTCAEWSAGRLSLDELNVYPPVA